MRTLLVLVEETRGVVRAPISEDLCGICGDPPRFAVEDDRAHLDGSIIGYQTVNTIRPADHQRWQEALRDGGRDAGE
ncbi:hypothetical protein ACWD7F_36935 [Streptomyces sp. NPDC005122]